MCVPVRGPGLIHRISLLALISYDAVAEHADRAPAPTGLGNHMNWPTSALLARTWSDQLNTLTLCLLNNINKLTFRLPHTAINQQKNGVMGKAGKKKKHSLTKSHGEE